MDPPKFKCDTCSRRYFEPLKLKQHYSDAHDSTETIQCEKCDFVAVHENTLKRHLINMHKKNSVKKSTKPQNSASKSKMNSQTLVLTPCFYFAFGCFRFAFIVYR